MKIGLLSLPLNWNYGGVLQQYALQRVLTDMGYEVKLLSRRKTRQRFLPKLAVLLKWKIVRILGRFSFMSFIPLLGVAYFKHQYLSNMSSDLYTNEEMTLYAKGEGFEALIVGSDQVWNPEAVPELSAYYLSFAEDFPDVKRISYGASFGKSEWLYTEEQTRRCSALVEKFTAISVREDSGVELCREHFNSEAVHVLDPTLLLSQDDYRHLFSKDQHGKSEGKLFTYILDSSVGKKEVVAHVASRKSLNEYAFLPHGAFEILKCLFSNSYPSVENWLRGFHEAEFVITDSFHGTLFSVLFNKPFIAVANSQRGLARFESFLKLFGLEERLIETGQTPSEELIESKINWDYVNEKISDYRLEAFNFIGDSLV